MDLASRTNLLSLNAATKRIVDSLGAIQKAVVAASTNAQSIAEVLKEMRGVKVVDS